MKTVKLHARVTREIEIPYEEAEKLINYITAATGNDDISNIIASFTDGIDPGTYETGYIPNAWLEADIKPLMDELGINMSTICNHKDIDL